MTARPVAIGRETASFYREARIHRFARRMDRDCVTATDPRFRVAWPGHVWKVNFGRYSVGWVVCDGERPITLAFTSFAKVARLKERIAEAYQRWGW